MPFAQACIKWAHIIYGGVLGFDGGQEDSRSEPWFMSPVPRKKAGDIKYKR